MILITDSGNAYIKRSCTVHLKNQQALNLLVTQVHSLGIYDIREMIINYQVIDSIITNDENLVKEILWNTNGVVEKIVDGEHHLVFSNFTSTYKPPKEFQILTPSSISLSLRPESYCWLGFEYVSSILNSKNIFLGVQGSMGSTKNINAFSHLNFSFGVGYQYRKNNIQFTITEYLGLYGGFADYSIKPIQSPVIFITPKLTYYLVTERPIYFNIGLDVFLYQESSVLPEDQSIISIGFGTEF